jgi:hypothetical protein
MRRIEGVGDAVFTAHILDESRASSFFMRFSTLPPIGEALHMPYISHADGVGATQQPTAHGTGNHGKDR